MSSGQSSSPIASIARSSGGNVAATSDPDESRRIAETLAGLERMQKQMKREPWERRSSMRPYREDLQQLIWTLSGQKPQKPLWEQYVDKFREVESCEKLVDQDGRVTLEGAKWLHSLNVTNRSGKSHKEFSEDLLRDFAEGTDYLSQLSATAPLVQYIGLADRLATAGNGPLLDAIRDEKGTKAARDLLLESLKGDLSLQYGDLPLETTIGSPYSCAERLRALKLAFNDFDPFATGFTNSNFTYRLFEAAVDAATLSLSGETYTPVQDC